MQAAPLLLPNPRQLVFTDGHHRLSPERLIVLDAPSAHSLHSTATALQTALRSAVAGPWPLVAGTAVPPDQIGILLSIAAGSMGHAQGYQLVIDARRITVTAESAAGVFYGVQTLRQLLEHYGSELPALRVSDWPDFPNRGVMLDISRDKVPTMATLFSLIDQFAGWKFNQVQLYTEHTFAYRDHRTVWQDASPITGEEILALDAYCRERFIELVPNQNSFGHLQRWLVHERYSHLAEAPDGCDTVWGHFDKPFSLYPAEPGSLALLRDLYDELLPHFSSRQFNVGCDETVDLGRGRSEALVKERGEGRVYLDFVMQIYREVKARGKTMQFWGDIIMNHPELAAELPRDAIALEWGYEANHPFDEHGALFAASGVPFYVCPGSSSWNTVAGRTSNAVANLRNAAANGLKHGAIGYLMTDWGDNGHWQPLPVSYLGFAYGAALSWCYAANEAQELPALLDRFAFQDKAGVLGKIACELGDLNQVMGMTLHNSTPFFHILQSTPEKIGELLGSDALASYVDRFGAALQRIDEILAPLAQAALDRPDGELIKAEFAWAAELLRHSCRRAYWMAGVQSGDVDEELQERLATEAVSLLHDYQPLWLARNRPGGYAESAGRLETMRDGYQR